MRLPSDAPQPAPTHLVRRYQVWILVLIVVVIFGLILVQELADVFTNYLWYRSVSRDAIWRSMMTTKIELALVFMGIFFVACWASLFVVDRIAPRALFMSPELELVRRYQATMGRHRVAVRTVVSVVVALAVGSSATGQWQNWLLFIHGRSFSSSDAEFHKNVGFFVFRLPFLSFLVDWTQLALIILLIVCVLAHYLNGGLRFSGPSPRVDPRTTAHLSVIFAAFALLRAAAYVYVDRYVLDLAPNGLFDGAGYTAVHVRLPALNLLAIVALFAFGLLIYNLYYRSWVIPVVALGLWAFLALVIGVIFPAAVQALQVTPAQASVELPYLSRNIAATQAAMGLDKVQVQRFSGATNSLYGGVVASDSRTLQSVDFWDPSVAGQAYATLQKLDGYYSINGLALDRYMLGTGSKRALTPAVVGVREISEANLNRPTWVNQHLVYTHGYGVVMSPANTSADNGQPAFDIQSVPPHSSNGAPVIRNPDVYYGLGQTGYVVVDSAQPELDYQTKSGRSQTSHYGGTGGIKISGFWERAAFALRFHDLNLLVSKQITSHSRIMFNQDIRSLVAKSAPFLRVDSNPYPVVENGRIDWIVDAYTTSSSYPYGQQAMTGALSPTSSLQGNYNYVRDAVKVVINAYNGTTSFYAMDPNDPVLQAWEAAFPGMFKPRSDLPSSLVNHLRYPQDLLTVQASMFGRYHIPADRPSEWYNSSAAWTIAQSGKGSSPYYRPIYQLVRLPGQSSPSFNVFVPFVPAAKSGGSQNLAAFMVASCAGSRYGQLTSYEVPAAGSVLDGPAIVNSTIEDNQAVSSKITLLDRSGSTVLRGPTLFIPIDNSLLYIRVLYVSATSNNLPELQDVIVVYGSNVSMSTHLLGAGGALAGVFGPEVTTIGVAGPTTIPTRVYADVGDAYKAYLALLASEHSAPQGQINWTEFGKQLVILRQELSSAELQLKQAEQAAAAARSKGAATSPAPTTAKGANHSSTGSGGAKKSGAAAVSDTGATSATSGTGPYRRRH
jgi:uncharacterized membrane protein (UPF0182 family)